MKSDILLLGLNAKSKKSSVKFSIKSVIVLLGINAMNKRVQ